MASPTTDRRQGLVGNVAMKAPVTVLAASNITLSGQQTIDGVAVLASNAAGVPDRVLCIGQTDATQNGIWDVSTSAWSRSKDANGNYDLAEGSTVLVTQGTTYTGTYWKITTTGRITIGTTSITWDRALASSIDTVYFLQSGTGAVRRGAQEKMRDLPVDGEDYDLAVDGVTDDLTKLQQLATYAVDNKSHRVVLPAGVMSVNGTLQLKPSNPASFGTLEVGGAAGGFLGNTRLVHNAAQKTNPLINLQSSRSIRLYDFEIRGNNTAPSNLANTGSYNVADPASWLSASVSEGRYNPYAGIAIDALAGADPGAGSNYPFGSGNYNQTTSSKGFIERVRSMNFAVGIAIHPAQNDSGSEDIVVRDSTIVECKYAIANTASQQRNIIVDNTNINGAWCAFVNTTFGPQNGPPMTVTNCILGHIYRLFQTSSAIGVGTFERNYCESVSTIGIIGTLNNSARMPFSSRSNNYSLVGTRGTSSEGQKDDVAKFYAPTKFDGDAFNWQYAFLVYPGQPVMFDNVGFNCEQNGTGEREGFQIFTPQSLEHLVSCRGVYQRSFSSTTKYFDDIVMVTTIPSRAYIGRNTRMFHRTTDKNIYKLTGGVTTTVTATINTISYVDADTITFTETTATKVLYVGAKLYWRVSLPIVPGAGAETAIFPCLIVTAYNSGTGATTCKIQANVDTSYSPGSVDIFIPHFINATQATGDTTAGNADIINVTNISNFVVNDWIRTTGASNARRVTAIAGTTLTMHTTMTLTVAGTGLFNTPLTAL